MELEKIHELERVLLFLMIIALPINCLPIKYSITLFGQNLTDYFFYIGFALLVYEFVKFKFIIPKRMTYFICAYTIWQCVCLVIGLYNYQYDSYLSISQTPKLEWLFMKINEFGIIIPEMLALKTWLFCSGVKRILFFENIVFGIMFYVYHLYKQDFNKAFRDMRKAVTVLVVIMGVYSLIELSWLKLSLQCAEDLLRKINPILYDVEVINTWWPPLLWNGQLRSMTREPSFFGILSIMTIPFLWSYVVKEKNNLILYLLLYYYNLMIFATNARTAIAVTLCQFVLLVLFALVVYNKKMVKKIGIILMITVLAFWTNLVDFKNLVGYNYINKSPDLLLGVEAYIDNNINSLANTSSRSNGARWANLVANLCVIRDHPIFGVGRGLKDAYMYDYILEFGKNNQEVKNWSKDMIEKGVLRSEYPPLNKFADVAVQNGLPGLALYILPINYIIYFFCKNKCYINNVYALMAFISMIGLLAAQLSNAGFAECNGFIWGLLLCVIESEDTNKKDNSTLS